MGRILDPILDVFDGLLGWMSSSLGQLNENYCQFESADSPNVLCCKDGSLASIIKIQGASFLVGPDEFEKLHGSISNTLQTSLSRPGHAIQVYFSHDKDCVERDLNYILEPAQQTAERLHLNLTDLFEEKIEHLSRYCASETIYMVLMTRQSALNKAQADQSIKDRVKRSKAGNIPPMRNAQDFLAAIPELRDTHDSFVKATVSDFNSFGLLTELIPVHDACRAVRESFDPEFTAPTWRPYLPGDKIPVRESKNFSGEISDILWPPLAKQLMPRDGEIIDLRTTRIGDRIYASVFIDLFPQEVQQFGKLFSRCLHAKIPWRVSFLVESEGMRALGLKPTLAAILSFASSHNKLLTSSAELLKYLEDNTDDAIVKLRVSAATWAPVSEMPLLRRRLAELAKAIQGWGYCETSEVSGDSFQGAVSSALGLTMNNVAVASVAPLSDVVYMLPITRPASPWQHGAVMFRSPDGKPWPYQPGSTLQTTWIDIIYARPGSGKSVLSNSINLAQCLMGGLQRLPRIAIVDIGPSSSGLISLLQEALPLKHKHLVAYHRLSMSKDMAINPFDTQLGCRYPTPQERAFLVNFLTLLATPVGETKSYDGISDMAGLIVEQLYDSLADDGKPHLYTANLEPLVDKAIAENNIKVDSHSTWWELTDELFRLGFTHIATLAQRYAMPLLADAASICRTKAIEDLYGDIKAPTGETLINAFGRMVSSAIREYPILSSVTAFDIGEARVVSLDLDEVAKSGGDAADRQTAIMYMLARYVLARHYYLTEDALKDLNPQYSEYHNKRILEIREDPKRIVFDEFHRTAKAKSVRDQVLVDMREGRKWKVQVALLSQSIEDFDPVMIEFATSVFIMDAGPKQAIEKSAEIFGLSDTAKLALATRVHGPKAGGATFLAQFATKSGVNTQLITSTIGPIELWAFTTTAEDSRIRNALYKEIGANDARRLLAHVFPSGSATGVIEEKLNAIKDKTGNIIDTSNSNIVDDIIQELLNKYNSNVLQKET